MLWQMGVEKNCKGIEKLGDLLREYEKAKLITEAL
jgi:hypothetical protein